MKNWTLKELNEICNKQLVYEKDPCENCSAKEFCKTIESGQTPANIEIEDEIPVIRQEEIKKQTIEEIARELEKGKDYPYITTPHEMAKRLVWVGIGDVKQYQEEIERLHKQLAEAEENKRTALQEFMPKLIEYLIGEDKDFNNGYYITIESRSNSNTECGWEDFEWIEEVENFIKEKYCELGESNDVKQAQREVLEKLVTRLSERSAELKKQEEKCIIVNNIETAVRFNARLQEVNQLIDNILELIKEKC